MSIIEETVHGEYSELDTQTFEDRTLDPCERDSAASRIDKGPSPLHEAVTHIIELMGLDILQNSRRFTAALMDEVDENDREARMLILNLDDDMLRPLTNVLCDTKSLTCADIEKASQKTASLLYDVHFVDKASAHSAMNKVAEGIIAYLQQSDMLEETDQTKVATRPEQPKDRKKGESKTGIGSNANHTTGTADKRSSKGRKAPKSGKDSDSSRRPRFSTPILVVFLAIMLVVVSVFVFWPRLALRFDANGGDGSMAAIAPEEPGEEVSIPEASITRDGYSFLGWSSTASGRVEYKAGDKLPIDEPTTLFAVWAPQATFLPNAKDAKGATDTIIASQNGKIVLPECGFERAGYHFYGWSTTKNGSDSISAGKDEKIGSPTTYYAMWKALASFEGNGSTGGETEAVTVDTSGKVKLPECGFTREGCTFLGWLKKTSGFSEGAYYTDDDLLSPGNTVNLKNKPQGFVACWKYDDATVERLNVQKIERSGNEGKTFLLIIKNVTDYNMDLEGEMRYVSSSGEILAHTDIFSPCVAKGDVVAQTFADYGKGEGNFEYTLEARPSRYGSKSFAQSISTKEISVNKGILTLEITNTSEDTIHLVSAKAYATQSGRESSGGFAFCEGEGYEDTLDAGASTTISFGSSDWEAPWPDLKRVYYFDGYVE